MPIILTCPLVYFHQYEFKRLKELVVAVDCFCHLLLLLFAVVTLVVEFRYVVCEGFRDPDRTVFQYLIGVNDTLNELRLNDKGNDVKEVVPLEMLLEDAEFFQYMKNSNERWIL